jgi:hypothetical protein
MKSIRDSRISRSLLILTMGVACIGVGFLLHQQHQPYANGISTTGTVTGVEKGRDQGAVLYSRVVTFTASNGRKVSATEPEATNTRPDMGERVEVSYLESDPKSARIIPAHDWLPYGFIAVGVLTTLAGLVTFAPRRGRQNVS